MPQYAPPTERPTWVRAERIKASANVAADKIRARRDLSAPGRQRQLARLHVDTAEKLTALRSEDRAAQQAQASSALDALFKPRNSRDAAALMAERDAAQRALTIRDADEARRLLKMAHDLDDASLARAVARRATELHDAVDGRPQEQAAWDAVLDDWAASPLAPAGAADNLTLLTQLGAETDDTLGRFMGDQHYTPDLAPELAPVRHRLDRLAFEADPDAEPAADPAPAWAAGIYNDSPGAA